MPTARVARIHEYGPPEVLRFEDIVVGEPGDDEVGDTAVRHIRWVVCSSVRNHRRGVAGRLPL